MSDTGEIEKIVDGVMAANPGQVAEYRAGREKAFNFLVGQAMKATQGKANPAQVNEILKRRTGCLAASWTIAAALAAKPAQRWVSSR